MSSFTPNAGQRAAIGAPLDEPVRVVAGAGTGKTEVISRRFVHLLSTYPDLRPEQILVLTFSEKAAAEMRARIFRAVSEAGLGYRRLDLAAASISTFHAFGLRLLSDHSLRAGIDAEQPLLSEVDVAELFDAVHERFLASGFAEAYGEFDPLAGEVFDWTGSEPFDKARAVVTQLRNQALSPSQFKLKVVATETDSQQHAVLAPLIQWLYEAFVARLEQRGQLDFDRIVTDAAWLLERDTALAVQLHAQYRYVLVDEYQDTNYAQEHLLRALAAPGLTGVTVVGDPRQAIYVWREARVENIAQFPGKRGGVRVDAPLTENRRSLAPILAVANRAIGGYEFGESPEFVAADELVACADNAAFDGTVVSLHFAPEREGERALIVEAIRRALSEGYHYRDIAILLRARTFLNAYVDALSAAGIPIELSSEDAFYIRPEILDTIHLLRVCLDPAEELSLARVLLSPAVGLTQPQVAALKRAERGLLWERVRDESVWNLPGDAHARLSRFVAFWHDAQRERWLRSPTSFVAWAIHSIGLDSVPNAQGRRALQKLLAIAHGYEADHPADTLTDLAEYLRRVLDSDLRAKAPELGTGEDAVRVLTAHASKGLEFPMVIAADNRQRVKPNRDKQPFHEPDQGLVFPEEDEDDSRFVERMRRQRNEARCLWYVTLTRAKRRLVITATDDAEHDGERFAQVKTFFEELWNAEVEEPSAGVERVSFNLDVR